MIAARLELRVGTHTAHLHPLQCHWQSRHFTRTPILITIIPLFIHRPLQITDVEQCATSMKSKKTILCVDGNDQMLSIRKVMLETRGYRVVACNQGEMAVAAFRRGGIDLVLADLSVPGLDGARVIEQTKAIAPHIPALLLSNQVKPFERDTLADLFLTKGMYEPIELLEKIRVLLVRKRGPKRSLEVRSPAAERATA